MLDHAVDAYLLECGVRLSPTTCSWYDELFRVIGFYHIEPNQVAEVLGYGEGLEEVAEDMRLQSLLNALVDISGNPEAETIYTALEWLLRGSHR